METGLVEPVIKLKEGIESWKKEKADAQSDKLAHQPFIEMNSRCVLKPQSFDR